MVYTRMRSFLLLLLLFAAPVVSTANAQQQPADSVKRQLYESFNKGDVQRFATLVDSTDKKQRDEFLLYVLSQAKQSPIEFVRVLLDKGAAVNQPTRYKTPLMHAAGEGYADVVTLLLARGAEVNVITDEGNAVMEAVKGGHVETLKLLLEAKADVKAVHRTGEQALMMAARQRSYRTPSTEPNPEIVRLLLAHGADPNAKNRWDETALMFANTAAKVKLLAAKGADLEAKDQEGRTALMKAASRGDVGVVGALVENGANVNAVDSKGSNALFYALDRENTAYGDERATLPARRLEIARRLLLTRSLDVNAQNSDGETALIRAVRLQNVEMIRSLLERGADANRSDVFGDTAATLAYASGKAEIEQLLPAPAFKGQPLNVLNAFLRAAIGRKDEPNVKALLAAGADPNHEYAIGYTHKSIKSRVLVLAAGLGHPGIVQLLLNKGADINAKGLISGSEHGLEFGTALEAAEQANKPEVVALLRKARQD
ncbi:MAG TPA: ankyrin repeat domain-containing protein [Pyrinomonadaceae bacterium]|nr:ankyrin repeat domain-containing protein [Pyrinomonadaceae bacterium]